MSVLNNLWVFIFAFFSKIIIKIQDKIRSFKAKHVSVWNIFYRKREEISLVREDAFLCSFSKQDPIEKLLEPNHVAVEYNDKKVVILKCPGDVYNTEKYPFFYHGAYLEATEKIVAPASDFLDFIDEQPWPEVSVIFLWSIGRCGSTLLANLFTSFEGFVTISEPDDIFTFFGSKADMGDAMYEKALKNSLKYHLIQVKARYPNTRCVIIKPRSMSFWYIAKSPMEIYEKVTHIFMYRDVIPTFKSFYKSFGKLAPKTDSMLAKVFGLNKMIQGVIVPLEKTLEAIPEMQDIVGEASGVRTSSNEMLVQMSFGGLPYLILLYKTLAEKQTFGERLFAVKYERLIQDPLKQFELISARIKSFEFTISEKEREKLTELSKKDSQANSALSKKNLAGTSDEVDPAITQKFEEMMGACKLEEEKESGFILQDTV